MLKVGELTLGGPYGIGHEKGSHVAITGESPVASGTITHADNGFEARHASELGSAGGSTRLERAFHPAGDDGEAAGPVHGKEAEGTVEVHADVGDVVGQLG